MVVFVDVNEMCFISDDLKHDIMFSKWITKLFKF